jgi:two-component system LytT family response regulator
MVMSLFIADDEPLARRRLRSIAAKVEWLSIVGEAADGEAAFNEIVRLRPDMVLLDIRMPEMSGLDVLRRLRQLDHVPAVILTTAHDQFAVRAFELEVLDYVLKPIVAKRCIAALERARRMIEMGQAEAMVAGAQRLFEPALPLEWILVRSGTTMMPVKLAAVMHIEAQDDYVLLHGMDRDHLASIRMHELESRLSCPPFVRVHRSHIVNLDHVSHVAGEIEGRLKVTMANGSSIPVSRDRARELRRLAR